MPTTFETRLAFNRGEKKGREKEAKKDQFQALAPSYTVHVSVCRRGGKREKEKEKAIDSGVTPP